MRSFADSTGKTWEISIDGLLLADLKQIGIDLVEDGLYLVEEREDVLLKCLLCLCADQKKPLNLSDREFAKRITGDVLTSALEAVRGAAADFFPPRRWSELQSRLEKQREIQQTYSELAPMLRLMNGPGMPDVVKQAIAERINTSSAATEQSQSVRGQDVIQRSYAGGSQDSLVSTRAG